MTDDWHARLSAVGWFFQHLEDVLSDMSVFHRVDELDQLPAAVFLPRMVRLPVYDGAVRHALRCDAEQPPTARTAPAPRQAPSVTAHSRAELAALNQSSLYGPLPAAGQAVGIFDMG
ncbi:hypothetical protein AB0383_19670 [Amycolatopsis sp. NPDC051373]|uniref:hypothetical protein n=1 Tax=Amycolatopsis sp. NPDC051373 TaxID=3155801 RepID=UPI00344BEDF9